jgi:Concanavalin A-like lectin/glucanases superfamily
MAIRCDTSADNLSRTTALPSPTSWTGMAWVYLVTNNGTAFQGALSLGSSAAFYAVAYGVSGTLKQAAFNNSAVTFGATTVATATWIHFALTVAGTGANQMLIYRDGVVEQTLTAITGVPTTSLFVGSTQGGDPMNGRVAAIKVWNAVLTADEIRTEMRQYQPQRTLNLLSWHPMLLHTDLAQYGATWTAGGTLTTEDGPPIPWSRVTPSSQRPFAVAAATVFPMRPVVQLQAVASGLL